MCFTIPVELQASAVHGTKEAICRIGKVDHLRDDLISGGATVDQARAAIFDELRRQQEANSVMTRIWDPGISMGRMAEEKSNEAAIDAILIRSGVPVKSPALGYNELMSYSLMDITRDKLRAAGIPVRGLSLSQIYSRSIEGRGQRAHMTTDFPSLLAAVPNKALLVGYQEAPATWDPFVKQTDVRDYKTQSRTALSEAPGLDNIKEHGDYKYGSWSDRKETFAAGKKG
ncbi:MAG: hypothetical protein AB9873_00655 [Syntrophobacteraceae bacterium]